jgi:hypothetical protein
MKTTNSNLFIMLILSTYNVATAQGTFQDLNFEEATIVPISGEPNAVTVANALPSWAVYYGSDQETQITYNQATTGGTVVSVLANGYPGPSGGVLDGNFSVLLEGGLNPALQPANATISQTGQIPAGSESLLFYASYSAPEVSIGSDVLTLFPVTTTPSHTIYGANISAWAGQTEELTFSAAPPQFSEIDDISFSSSPITVTPEPDALTLMSIGGLLFGLYRRLQARRK